jgi:hypothetical protein
MIIRQPPTVLIVGVSKRVALAAVLRKLATKWGLFGAQDPQGADYRACQNFGPLYG